MEITALSIPETDRENVQILSDLLVNAGRSLGHDLDVVMVGGATSKPWPRKDIDLLCTLKDLRGKLNGTELEKASMEQFELLEVARKALEMGDGFELDDVVPPYEDHEFQNPNILSHRGVIRIRPQSGVLIEIIGGLG